MLSVTSCELVRAKRLQRCCARCPICTSILLPTRITAPILSGHALEGCEDAAAPYHTGREYCGIHVQLGDVFAGILKRLRFVACDLAILLGVLS